MSADGWGLEDYKKALEERLRPYLARGGLWGGFSGPDLIGRNKGFAVVARFEAAQIAEEKGEPDRGRHHRENAEHQLDEILNEARKNKIDFLACFYAIDFFTDQGIIPPGRLTKFALQYAHDEFKKPGRGHERYRYLPRDSLLCRAVDEVAELGLQRYGNKSRSFTAVDVVSAVINEQTGENVDPDTIVKILKKSDAMKKGENER